MKKAFDFSKMVSQVYKQAGGSLTLEQVEELLTINEDAYSKDSPLSVGKRLMMRSLEFRGEKGGVDGVVQPINYRREFGSGVYLWVGDNLVGKSSIFKIIKLAITGNKKISRDVESWLSKIWLEFSLGSNEYTVIIERPDLDPEKDFKYFLYTGVRKEFMPSESMLFEGSAVKYKEFMQSLFFREMSYYHLQWTQHDSRADSLELRTSNASWSTYYKSVFLEAEDYNTLFFGSQAELIFQMLLGLELTYPINRLKVKRKFLENELGKQRSISEAIMLSLGQEQQESDEKELAQLIQELEGLANSAKIAMSVPDNNLEQNLEKSRTKYRIALQKRNDLEVEKDNLEGYAVELRRKIHAHTRQISDFETEINKKNRRKKDVQEYLDLGGFFSSLEVRTCPNCNHAVESKKVLLEKDTGNCRLCEHEVAPQPIDKDAYEKQIQELEGQRQALFQDQYLLRMNLSDLVAEEKRDNSRISLIKDEIFTLNVDKLFDDFEALRAEVTKTQPVRFDLPSHIKSVAALSERKGILEQKLKPVETTPLKDLPTTTIFEHQIAAIEIAVTLLDEERQKRSQSLINIFENLYLKQLHAFGLPHYDGVQVRPNFKLAYSIRGNEHDFNDITPGEKLRAKLGFYIALIELDVEHQLGRHPRFLVLDSPAREEGDHTYVDGLKTTLDYIQKKFGGNLQVFVGTAQRELESAIDSDQVEVKMENQYFF